MSCQSTSSDTLPIDDIESRNQQLLKLANELSDAYQNCDDYIVDTLLKGGVDPMCCSADTRPMFYYVVLRNDMEMMHRILDAMDDTNVCGYDEYIKQAASSYHMKMCALLLERRHWEP